MTGKDYALESDSDKKEIAVPSLTYRPPQPKKLSPAIGLVGCGGITKHHLQAYRDAGWDVVAMYNRSEEALKARSDEFYPEATLYNDINELLAHPGLNVVDLAAPPTVRAEHIALACKAGKHILSQKPLAESLEEARRLTELTEAAGVKAAVNQNGRWAPYFAWMQAAVRAGSIGDVNSVSMTLNWDHSWTQGTPFENIQHLILYDFGIHWFDQTAQFFHQKKALEVYAANAPSALQTMSPPLLASATIRYERGLATLQFNGHSTCGTEECITVCGTQGTLRSRGEPCSATTVELHTPEGVARPQLEGAWFNDGFRGTMGELLSAIEEDREPQNSFRNNLQSLELCFAALESSETGQVVRL